MMVFIFSAPRVWRAILVLLIITVSYLALTPAPPHGADLGWDKLNHISAFSALAFAGWLGVPSPRRSRLLMLVSLLAYGGAIEIIQLYVPGRSCEWSDLLADAIGIAGGALVAAYLPQTSTMK